MTEIAWGKFQKLNSIEFTVADWRETIDGGQAFTWFETDTPNEYQGVFSNVLAKIRLVGKSVEVAFPTKANEKKSFELLCEYLDVQTDYKKIRNALKRTNDKHIATALKLYPTLRILRQNPAEAIICFICSSSKRIVQIKQCVKLLSKKFGKHLGGGFYALPDFKTLANAKLEDILDCKLGFRARYLHETAKKIVGDKFNPQNLRDMDYEKAKSYLTSLSGIGEKVADCILLFGCSRLEAFPVDTWIKQAMHTLYSTDNNAKKIRELATQKFPNYAGFAQQLLFAAKRNSKI